MSEFCLQYDLSNLIREPTCYKNLLNPSCIDVILTNKKHNFQNSFALETGLSDHHLMVVTVLKTYIKKEKPIIVPYRTYKSFCMDNFKEDLKQNLEHFQEEMAYDDFKHIFTSTLNNHAPERKKP